MDLDFVRDDTLNIILDNTLDFNTTASVWDKTMCALKDTRIKTVNVDASQLECCDSSGIGLLIRIQQIVQVNGADMQISGLREQFQKTLGMFRVDISAEPTKQSFSLTGLVSDLGRLAVNFFKDVCTLISFTGELTVKLVSALLKPGSLRWSDTWLIIEKSGTDALGIICLMGFLIGLILAFQSAVAMSQFGAEVFVADLVVLSLFRELGPLIAAFILASRSGSAFAAELGTMKVNEEIDALVTMGIDPVKFLVIPRIIGAVIVLPLLTLFNNAAGLIGCSLVMSLLGYPMVTFISRIQLAAGMGDLLGGLAKTFVFAVLIAGIGCLRGLQAGKSASAVGDAATSAVVSGIIAIIAADGIFAVLYYLLGI